MVEILAIIPARGGSKGVPRKNIRPLAGKPLIFYTIEAAKRSIYITRTVVSTEDAEIADVARNFGAEVLKRPPELARDDTPTIDVVIHVLDTLEREGYYPDVVVLLQPTSPLRTSDDIDNAIELFLSCDCDSVISVSEYDHPPFWAMEIRDGFLKPLFGEGYFKMRRQDLPKAYRPNGAIYISRPEAIRRKRGFISSRTVPYVMPPEKSIDIDSEIDFIIAEMILRCEGGNYGKSKNR